jgi:WD40 repeat protein
MPMPLLLIVMIWLSMTAQASSLSEVSVLKTWKHENWASSQSTITSPDARFVATQEKESMVVREIETSKAVFKVTAPNDTLRCFPYGFSKQGDWFYTLCYNRLRVWDWKTKKVILEHSYLGETSFYDSDKIYFSGNLSKYFLFHHFCNNKGCEILRFYKDGRAESLKVNDSYKLFKIVNTYAIFLDKTRKVFAISNLELAQPPLVVFEGHTTQIRDIAIDLSRNFVISQTGSTKIWDLESGLEVATLIDPNEPKKVSHSSAEQVTLSLDGKWFFTISQSETKIWNLETRSIYKILKYSVLPLFSQNGQVMIHAQGGDVVFTQVGSFDELFRLKSHLRRAYPQAISSDGTRLVSTSVDKTLKVWNPKQKKLLKTLGVYRYSVVNDFGTVIGLARGDGIMRFYKTKSGRYLSRVFIGSDYGEKHLKISPDGRYLVFGEVSYQQMIMERYIERTRVRLWNINTGRLLWKNTTNPTNEIMFRSDGKKIAALSGEYGYVYAAVEFDTLTGRTKKFNLPTSTLYFNYYSLLHEVNKQFKVLVTVNPQDSQRQPPTDEGFVFNLTTQKTEKVIKEANVCFLSSSTNLNRYLRCQLPKIYSREDKPDSVGFSEIEQSPSEFFSGYFGILTLVQPFKDGVKFVGNLAYGVEEPSLDSLGFWSSGVDPSSPQVKNFSSNGLYFFTHSKDGIYMLGSKKGKAIF